MITLPARRILNITNESRYRARGLNAFVSTPLELSDLHRELGEMKKIRRIQCLALEGFDTVLAAQT
jgi:hypothetical protein